MDDEKWAYAMWRFDYYVTHGGVTCEDIDKAVAEGRLNPGQTVAENKIENGTGWADGPASFLPRPSFTGAGMALITSPKRARSCWSPIIRAFSILSFAAQLQKGIFIFLLVIPFSRTGSSAR